jgi:hypothetical protein
MHPWKLQWAEEGPSWKSCAFQFTFQFVTTSVAPAGPVTLMRLPTPNFRQVFYHLSHKW